MGLLALGQSVEEVPRVWQGPQARLWEEGVSDPVPLSWGAGLCPGFQWVKNPRRDETQGQAICQEHCCQERQGAGVSWQQGCEVLHPCVLTRMIKKEHAGSQPSITTAQGWMGGISTAEKGL